MIREIKPYFAFEDERGSIRGIINAGEWREMNMVTSKAGVTRGGHYHKETEELFIVLEGEVEVTCVNVDQDGKPSGEKNIARFGPGQVFMIEPYASHEFKCIVDSKWINALSKAHDKNAPDMFTPLP